MLFALPGLKKSKKNPAFQCSVAQFGSMKCVSSVGCFMGAVQFIQFGLLII